MQVAGMGVLFTTLAMVFWRWYRVESPSLVAPRGAQACTADAPPGYRGSATAGRLLRLLRHQ
jgi:CBS-domain-containing membrane protein